MNHELTERIEQIRAKLVVDNSYDAWVPVGERNIHLLADDGSKVLVLVGLGEGPAAARRSAHQVRHQARSISANRLVVMLVQPVSEEQRASWTHAVSERGSERELLCLLLPLPSEDLGASLTPILGLYSVTPFLAEIRDSELVASMDEALADVPDRLRAPMKEDLSAFLGSGGTDASHVFLHMRAHLGLPIPGVAS